MSSPQVEPSTRKISYPTILVRIFFMIIYGYIFWCLPFVQQIVVTLFEQPGEISLPTLTGPDTIRPETVANVHLLEHWGNGEFRSLAWSPDGRYFAIGTVIGVNLYEAKTFQLLRYIGLPIWNLDALAFSSDSRFLAAAGYGEEGAALLVLDLSNDKILQQWDDLDRSIAGLNYLKDGTLVREMETSGGSPHSILKWINDRWETIPLSTDDFIEGIAFVPEKQAYAVFYQNSVRLVDPLSGAEETLRYTLPYGDYIFTHDILLTMDRDNSLFSVYTEEHLFKRVELESGMSQLTVSPDGRMLATLGPRHSEGLKDGNITLWSIPALQPVHTISVPDMGIRRHNLFFSPSGDQLAILVSDSAVRIFSTADPKSEIVIGDPFSSIVDVAITPDGEIRALRVSATTLELVQLPSGTLINKWHFTEHPYGRLLGDAVTVAVARVPFGNLRLYRAGKFGFPVSVRGRCCSTFSSDGSVGAAIGPTETSSGAPIIAAIWQKKFDFYQEWRFSGWNDDFRIAVSPSGQYVAATGSPNTYLWINGVKSFRRYPSLGRMYKIAFSPDERHLASTRSILDLKTDLVTPAETEIDDGNFSYEAIPAFSPDGQIMAAQVNGLRFWQVSDGALLAKFYYPYSTDRLVFSPDGKFLVGLGDGFVNVWGISELPEPIK